jgi:hypothetical protein
MTRNLNIINWDNILAHSKTIQDQKPTKWAFIEEFFVRDFYEKLYETYPKKDESWFFVSTDDKSAYRKFWGTDHAEHIMTDVEDTNFSESWNQFHNYLFSDEFISNIRKFSGVSVNRVKHFAFTLLTRGGYQLPHIHNAGPNTLIFMLYFSKNWKKGDPGGTYITTEEDESKMIFEPYNLDNTGIVFHDGPHAGHGVRYITKDVERRAIQIYLEKYSPKTGWSVYPIKRELREI